MSKLSELELITSVDLNYTQSKDGKPTYHLIYTSELYGTMFGIYARFEGEQIALASTQAFQVKKIILKLVNYKGCINIGFYDEKMKVEKKTHSLGYDYFDITFNVIGASAIVDKEFDFTEASNERVDKIQVKKGDRLRVIFNRFLLPLTGFEGYLDTRDEVSLENPIKDETPISPLFDTEFHDRDGKDFYNRVLRPGLYNPNMPAAGYRCNTSDVNLSY